MIRNEWLFLCQLVTNKQLVFFLSILNQNKSLTTISSVRVGTKSKYRELLDTFKCQAS